MHALFEDPKFAKLNWVVIETTGIADPAPLVQSLYMDVKCKTYLRMDSILTVVDAKHLELRSVGYKKQFEVQVAERLHSTFA